MIFEIIIRILAGNLFSGGKLVGRVQALDERDPVRVFHHVEGAARHVYCPGQLSVVLLLLEEFKLKE